jgi:Undecaprenyl-phosphate glucose phosphotransferase
VPELPSNLLRLHPNPVAHSDFLSRPEIRKTTPHVATPTRAQPTISNEQATSKLSLLATSVIIVATSVLSGNIYEFLSGQRSGNPANLWGAGVLVAIFFCSSLRLSEGRYTLKTSHIWDRARSAVIAWLTSFALFLSIVFTFKVGAELSRGDIISFFFLGLGAVTSAHMRVPIFLARIRKSGAFMDRDIIIVGAFGDPTIARLLSEFAQSGCSTPHVVEFDAECGAMEWPRKSQTVFNEVAKLAHRLGPGEIYLAVSRVPPARTEVILRALMLIPRAVLVVPDAFTTQLLRYRLTEIGNEIAIDVQKAPMGPFGRAVKRCIDIVLSSAAIVFFLPLYIAVAVLIKWDSPGPVLFRQLRNGYQGRAFRILKFRTMTVMEDGDIVNQASRDDARITRVGRWLRKTSIDELPQLINVLRGEMSLIGPRPHARAHDVSFSKLIDNYDIRQHVKPGITGWAQVNGLRGETQTLDLMYRRIELDLWYAKNCNILLDLRILARTVVEVIRPRNAY